VELLVIRADVSDEAESAAVEVPAPPRAGRLLRRVDVLPTVIANSGALVQGVPRAVPHRGFGFCQRTALKLPQWQPLPLHGPVKPVWMKRVW
jgi:hypothetical protein